MSNYRIHVFISHSWTYSGHYDKLYSWLFDHSLHLQWVQRPFLQLLRTQRLAYSQRKDYPRPAGRDLSTNRACECGCHSNRNVCEL